MGKDSLVSRRAVIGGIAATAAAPLLVSRTSAAPPPTKTKHKAPPQLTNSSGRLRYGHAMTTLVDGRLLLTGGYHEIVTSGTASPSSSVQIFDPSNGMWTDAAPLRTGRAQHASVRIADGRVLVLGGMSGSPLSSVEIYDPIMDTWTYGASLAQPLFGHAAAVSGSIIAISGGPNGISMQVYDPKLKLRTTSDF